MNPKSLKNLQPFKPGQSGNPAGRPKKRPITERYVAFAETPIEESERKKLKLPKGATYADALALAVYRRAINGEIPAIKEIREAIEGKAEVPIADEKKSIEELAQSDDEDFQPPSFCANRIIQHQSEQSGSGRWALSVKSEPSSNTITRVRSASTIAGGVLPERECSRSDFG